MVQNRVDEHRSNTVVAEALREVDELAEIIADAQRRYARIIAAREALYRQSWEHRDRGAIGPRAALGGRGGAARRRRAGDDRRRAAIDRKSRRRVARENQGITMMSLAVSYHDLASDCRQAASAARGRPDALAKRLEPLAKTLDALGGLAMRLEKPRTSPACLFAPPWREMEKGFTDELENAGARQRRGSNDASERPHL